MENQVLLDAIEGLVNIRSRECIGTWVEQHLMRAYRPGSVMIASCKTGDDFKFTPYHVTSGFPGALQKAVSMDDPLAFVPLLNELGGHSKILVRELIDTEDENEQSSLWKLLLLQKGVSRIAVAANCEFIGQQFCYICMTDPQIDDCDEEQFARAMTIIVRILGTIVLLFQRKTRQIEHMKQIDVLTPREQEIVEWIKNGKTNYEISKILGVAVPTVKNHVQKILMKLQVSNRTQAIHKLTAPVR